MPIDKVSARAKSTALVAHSATHWTERSHLRTTACTCAVPAFLLGAPVLKFEFFVIPMRHKGFFHHLRFPAHLNGMAIGILSGNFEFVRTSEYLNGLGGYSFFVHSSHQTFAQ